MKTLVQINVTCNGSTGRIMNQIQEEAIKQGWKAYSFFGRGNASNENCIKIDNKLEILFHVFLTRIFGKHGHGSFFATKRLIKKLKKINPDVIHLHNIHGYYLNLKVLFKYLENCNKKIIWTFHDCWAFTGHCSYFTMAKCNKWKDKCRNCPQRKSYPKSMVFDTSKKEFLFKKKLFTSLNNLTIVTPSIWLKDLVKESFFRDYEVKVIYNGVDLDVFKKTSDINVYDLYSIPKNKKIILGVASVWDKRKGLEDFIKLSEILEEDKYIIVLVGLNDEQIEKLTSKIVGIKRTENVQELATLYSVATFFVNPTAEDNFPTTNLEAIACGTPIITYKTGGSPEVINENTGIAINNNYKYIYDAICAMINKKFNTQDEAKKYDKNLIYNAYLELYDK